jgi:hypothetical protein
VAKNLVGFSIAASRRFAFLSPDSASIFNLEPLRELTAISIDENNPLISVSIVRIIK